MEQTFSDISKFDNNNRETNESEFEVLNPMLTTDNDKKEEKLTIPDRKNNNCKTTTAEKISNNRTNSDITSLNDLRLSVIQGNFEAAKYLIEDKGIFVDSILQAGWTALMYACSCGQYETVDYLLKQNADPNFHKDMFTPLMACCASRRDDEKNLFKCVVLLLEKGANINDKERHHMTPLLFASRQGHTSIVQKLIESGAEINRRDTRGLTALAWASNNGYGQIVRLLLNSGADPNIKTIDGQRAADLAYSKGYNQISEILAQACEKENSDTLNLYDRNKSNCVRNITHFSELELFFVGIGRGDLLPLFYENELSYKDLFKLNEEELEKIGVTDPNDRKTILKEIVSLSKNHFKTINVPEIQNRNISCTEAVMMMSNISKHLAYVGGVIVYLRQKIQTHPRILELSQQQFSVHNLIKETEHGIKNAHHLYEELKFLAMYLKNLQDSKYIPADVITEVACSAGKPAKWEFGSKSFYLLGITSLSLVFGSIWWRFPHLFVKYSVLLNIVKKIINR